jgi:hypothetical protein
VLRRRHRLSSRQFQRCRLTGTYPLGRICRLYVHMVFPSLGSGTITSLGSRFFGHVDWICKHSPTRRSPSGGGSRLRRVRTRSRPRPARRPRFRMVIAVEGVASRGQQPQAAPAAFLCEGIEPLGACFRNHDEVGPLGNKMSSEMALSNPAP